MADGDITENVTLWSNDKGKEVEVITDGSIERLAVDANITGGLILQKFTPKGDFNVTGTVTNTSTDTTLLSVTAAGKLDFIVIAGSNSNYEVVLVVDSIEVIRIKMSDLADLGLSNATNVSIWAETANKNFRLHPNEGVDFTTSFEVKVRATGTPVPTLKHLIAYREAA